MGSEKWILTKEIYIGHPIFPIYVHGFVQMIHLVKHCSSRRHETRINQLLYLASSLSEQWWGASYSSQKKSFIPNLNNELFVTVVVEARAQPTVKIINNSDDVDNDSDGDNNDDDDGNSDGDSDEVDDDDIWAQIFSTDSFYYQQCN